jgi:hypothetical protein
MDFPAVVGYLSGLYLVNPQMTPSSLFRTASLVHVVDALLCWLIAGQSRRNKNIWAAAGLLLGIWALGALMLLPGKNRKRKEGPP